MPSLISIKQFKNLLKPRKSDTNKGSYGHVYVIAGSYGKIGAGVLATLSVLKSGAGLSTLILPDSCYKKIDLNALEVMYEPIKDAGRGFFSDADVKTVLQKITKASVVVLGPGLGDNPKTFSFVQKILPKINTPVVLDADGLNAISKNPKILLKRKCLTFLTPHPGEMSRLTGLSISRIQENRAKIASEFSKKYKVILLLKGHKSVVAFPDGSTWINPTGNPGMASAGQGDVLSGIYAGLISEFGIKKEVFLLGCFLHGLVGNLLVKKGERVVLGTEIIKNLKIGFNFLSRFHFLKKRKTTYEI